MTPTRLALVCDYAEEGWPSMDLMGEMLFAYLGREHSAELSVTPVCPPYRHRMTRVPIVRGRGAARNADRLLNRFWDYPRSLGRRARQGEFDLYHLVDHSYSQLVHALPDDRTIVTCHDLDTFRCLLDPAREPRPAWFRAFARRTLEGMQK
ncbi:glycosyltransferase family 1 protein, partial [Singulisphaera rosea]